MFATTFVLLLTLSSSSFAAEFADGSTTAGGPGLSQNPEPAPPLPSGVPRIVGKIAHHFWQSDERISTAGLTPEQRSWLLNLEDQKINETRAPGMPVEIAGCTTSYWHADSEAALLDLILGDMVPALEKLIQCTYPEFHDACHEPAPGSGGDLWAVRRGGRGGILHILGSNEEINHEAQARQRLEHDTELLYTRYALKVPTAVRSRALQDLQDLRAVLRHERISTATQYRAFNPLCGGGGGQSRP